MQFKYYIKEKKRNKRNEIIIPLSNVYFPANLSPIFNKSLYNIQFNQVKKLKAIIQDV